MPKLTSILTGVRLALLDNNQAGKMLGARYRNFIIGICNAFSNLKVRVERTDGTVDDADIKMSEMGCIVTLKAASVSNGSNDWANPIVYNQTTAYDKAKLVVIRPTDAIVTAGAIDVDSGVRVYAKAGLWKATRAVPYAVNPHVPQWPLPTPDNPDAANVYWWPVSFYPTCVQ